MSRFPSGCASLVLAVFVSQAAIAQRPTISLRPIGGIVTRECVGGPDAGQMCTTTADCENDDGGAMHPECQRLCDGDPNQPCVTSLDCESWTACEQQCYCNSVIKAGSSLPFLIEIFASGWSPRDLTGFQVVIDFTDTANRVLPLGWDRPVPPIPCSSHADCPVRYPFCSDARCQGHTYDPSQGIITKDDLPGCEPGCCKFCTVDILTLRYRFGCSYQYLGPSCPPVTDPKWLATLILVPTEFACGTVTITPLSPPYSGLFDEHGTSMEPLDIEGLTLKFSGEAVPADCNRNGQPDEEEGLEPGDFDFNHTIDLADFAAFQRYCHGDWDPSDKCVCVFDFTDDGAVSCDDLGGFTAQLSGP